MANALIQRGNHEGVGMTLTRVLPGKRALTILPISSGAGLAKRSLRAKIGP